MKKSHKVIQDIIAKSKKKNIAFYIIVMVCMILFFFTLSGFIGIYGGGVVDYLTAGIISLILLEIFPFIWSLIIALFTYKITTNAATNLVYSLCFKYINYLYIILYYFLKTYIIYFLLFN